MKNRDLNVKYHTDKVAILLATYQGERYLKEQLDSLLKQTCTDWVACIHDDGSTDRTMDIVKTYENAYPDKFVVFSHESCHGAKDNFFYLLRAVDAPYLMCCDQDDIWLKDKIEITLQQMKKTEQEAGKDSPCLVCTDLQVIAADGTVQYKSMAEVQRLDFKRTRSCDLAMQNVVTGCTMMVNRAMLPYLHKVEDTDKIIWHDWWCGMIAAEFGRLVCLQKQTIQYRQHGDNSVGAKKVNSLAFIREKLKDARLSLQRSKEQVQAFCMVYKVDKESLLYQYKECLQQSKWKKIRFARKHALSKTGMFRKIGWFLFI